MSEVQFFQTKMGRQYYEVTLPNLVREIHRLNDMLGLAVELVEKHDAFPAPESKSEDTHEREK